MIWSTKYDRNPFWEHFIWLVLWVYSLSVSSRGWIHDLYCREPPGGDQEVILSIFMCQWYMNLTVYTSSPEDFRWRRRSLNVNVSIIYFYLYFWHLNMFIVRYFNEYTRLLIEDHSHGWLWLTGLYFFSNMIFGGLIWTAALWWLVSLIYPLIEDLPASIKIVNLKAFIEEKCKLLCHCSFYNVKIRHLKNIVSWMFLFWAVGWTKQH